MKKEEKSQVKMTPTLLRKRLSLSNSNPELVISQTCKTDSTNPPVKLALLGLRGSGKSALTVRFCTRRFIGEYDPNLETIASSFLYTAESECIPVFLYDTAEKDTEDKMRECLNWCDMYALVYSITDRRSFGEIQRLRTIANKVASKSPAIVIGNKRDLGHMRKVKHTEGLKLAQEMDCLFQEVSAADGYDQVYNMFKECVSFVVRRKIADVKSTPRGKRKKMAIIMDRVREVFSRSNSLGSSDDEVPAGESSPQVRKRTFSDGKKDLMHMCVYNLERRRRSMPEFVVGRISEGE